MSIVIDKKYINKIINWKVVSGRIITMNLAINCYKTTVVGIYTLNEDALLSEKDQFQKELEDGLSIGDQRHTYGGRHVGKNW